MKMFEDLLVVSYWIELLLGKIHDILYKFKNMAQFTIKHTKLIDVTSLFESTSQK